MGAERWYQYLQSIGASLGGDHDELIYARCIGDHVQKMMRKLSPSKRHRIDTMRKGAWLLMLACIVIQNELDGGGTSQVHLPRLARIDLEEATQDILSGASHRPWFPAGTYLRGAYTTLTAMKKSGFESPVSLREPTSREPEAVRRALHQLNAVSRFMKGASQREADLVANCLERYTYFGDHYPWDSRGPWLKPWK